MRRRGWSARPRGSTRTDALRVFVLMHEVAEGSWGAGGHVIRFEQLREAAKAERDKAGQAVPAGA